MTREEIVPCAPPSPRSALKVAVAAFPVALAETPTSTRSSAAIDRQADRALEALYASSDNAQSLADRARAVLVFARTPWGNAWIRGELTRRLNAHIAGTVAVGALELDPRRLILDDVTLAEPSGALVMRVKRIVVDIAPLGLLRREVHLVRLHAADPRLWLWREAGALDVQRALASRAGGARRKPSRAGTRWAFRLDAFSSTSGTVTYESAPPGEERTTTIALDDVTATGGGACHVPPRGGRDARGKGRRPGRGGTRSRPTAFDRRRGHPPLANRAGVLVTRVTSPRCRRTRARCWRPPPGTAPPGPPRGPRPSPARRAG